MVYITKQFLVTTNQKLYISGNDDDDDDDELFLWYG